MSDSVCPFFEMKCKNEKCALFIVEDYDETEGPLGRCAIQKIAVELENNEVIR